MRGLLIRLRLESFESKDLVARALPWPLLQGPLRFIIDSSGVQDRQGVRPPDLEGLSMSSVLMVLIP